MDQLQLAKAAKAVATSDVLLIAAGAGFSADSGLPTYAGIDDMEPYKSMGITYDRDLCNPGKLFERDPSLWLGFWANCWNDFSAATPHEGYEICRRWSDDYLRRSPLHADIVAGQRPGGAGRGRATAGRQARASKRAARSCGEEPSAPPPDAAPPAPVEDGAPGAAMVYTTNVDGFFVRTFPEHMVYERHGTLATWQCAARPAGGKDLSAAERKRKRASLLRLPWSHRFGVDAATRRLADPPLCSCCARPMRPCVMMFGDKAWVGAREGAEQAYEAWRELAIEAVLGRRGSRLCVLELGAGTRVPTLRKDVEYLVDVLEETGQARAACGSPYPSERV
eukprot:tig00020516_g9964.t1